MTAAAKVLIVDIETQYAIVEVWDLFRPFISIDRVLRPKRMLCFAAKWRDSDKIIFKAAWDDDDEQAYKDMILAGWKLLDEADIVVTWNGDRFDNQWFEGEFARLELGVEKRPRPYKSLDLFKLVRKNFKASLMSLKLDWSARMLIGDKKTSHGGMDLWHDIRYGTRAEKRAAQKIMKEYNQQDVVLTGKLLEKYIPWTNINFALYANNEDGLLHCTKCNSTDLRRAGIKMYSTSAFAYHMWRCKECGATSRGKRAKNTTELRNT